MKIKIPSKKSILLKKIIDFDQKQQGKGLKILTLKLMLQRLTVPLIQAKARNTSENLPNEIRQIKKTMLLKKYTTT